MQSNSPPPSGPVSQPQKPAPRYGPPDAGSPRLALIGLISALIFFVVVMVFQQQAVQSIADTKPVAASETDATVFNLGAKGFTKIFGTMFKDQPGAAGSQTMVVESIRNLAYTPMERLKAAVCAGELAGPDQAVTALDDAAKWVDEQVRDNRADPEKGFEYKDEDRAKFDHLRDLLLRHYRSKSQVAPDSSSPPKPLTDDEIATLKDKLGWFGRLSAAQGDPKAADRAALFAGSDALVIMMVLIGAGMSFAVLAGCILFIFAVVMLVTRRITTSFVPPAPGGSVYIETVAVFILGFIALKLVTGMFEDMYPVDPPRWVGPVHLGLQWLLALIPLYPLFRGVSFPQWREQIGLAAPKGVAREIGVGILAYFAGLPIFLTGLLISVILKFFVDLVQSQFGSGPSNAPISNPVFDAIVSSNPLMLVLLFSLVTLWAPFVEEAIFRGAFFRHLRSRLGLFLAAIASAMIFGGMHGYELVMLGPVISLGVVFALMREWRGSIIPCITAHMLHNGTVFTISIIMIKLISK